LSALIVLTSLWTIGTALISNKRSDQKFPFFLIIALSSFYFFNFVFGYAAVDSMGFSANIFYSFWLFFAITVAPPEVVPRLVDAAKIGITCVIALGIAIIPIDSNIVIQHGYTESWIQIPYRYFGLASHANGLGALALVLLMLEFMKPSKNKKIKLTMLFCGAFGLLMSQSKTAWGVGVASAALVVVTQAGRVQIRPFFAAILSPIIIFLSSFLWLLFFDSDFGGVVASSVSEDAASLTGRVGIWQVALDAWSSNPVLGYGPSIWGEDFRMANGMPFAFHAHNQFLQAASTSGTLGVITYLLYFSAMAYRLLMSSSATRGVGLCFLAMLIIRSVSEVPFAMNNVLSTELLIHAMAFLIATRSENLRTIH
jgi:O-antigen ligase